MQSLGLEGSDVASLRAVMAAVRDFMSLHGLWGGKYLIAVSGGVDSVVLLKALSELRTEGALSLGVFHLNHLFRCEASDADAHQVLTMSKALDIPCYSYRRPVLEMSQQYRFGFEDMGRRLRYQLMKTLQLAEGYQGVFTAHHADDQAETLLMHAFRGSGLKGLTGMAPRAQDRLRPFLKLEKSTLVAAAKAWGLTVCEDDTNTDTQYRRNALRVEILPLIESHFGAHVRRQLSEMAEALAEDEALLDTLTWATLKRHLDTNFDMHSEALTVAEAAFEGQPLGLRRRLVVALLQQVSGSGSDITREGVDNVLGWYAGAQVGDCHCYRGVHFERRRQSLRVMRWVDYQRPSPESVHVLKLGAQQLADWGIEWIVRHANKSALVAQHFEEPAVLVLPGHWRPEMLWIRPRLEGDAIALKGMGGKRKSVRKLLSESDLSSDQKRRLPMVATGPEAGAQILWIPGIKKSAEQCKCQDCPETVLVVEYRPIHVRKAQ